MPDTTPAGRPRCSYEFEGWHCPFDAHHPHPDPFQRTGEKADSPSPQGGEGRGEDRPLCIFHLPVERKKPEVFWRHLASYLVALLEKAGNNETEAWRKANPNHWVFREADPELIAAYAAVIPSAAQRSRGILSWLFTGFIFPAMDQTHNFVGFVFPAADFRDATFSGPANFRVATFSGPAWFGSATFSGKANFGGATFSGEADFSLAKFSGEADFSLAKFSGPANFRVATFSGKANFRVATFSGPTNFEDAKFSGPAYFRDAKFSGKADFSLAKFSGEVDFSFAQFAKPPSFAQTGFKARVDFYEAKVPGLSGDCDERDARNIRLLAERHGSYADAGDFYRIEMDFRRRRFRKTQKRWFQYGLMELYRLSSRYGESPGWALVWLIGLLLAFGVFFTLARFTIGGMRGGFLGGIVVALVNLLPGNLRGETLGVQFPSTCGKALAVAQVILSYIVLTLFLLAIRRRFRR